ncbi:MAG: GDSL-type esterase/lipase family protein [[Clostridium] fimetarium]|nr:GDSL-type esterase/lipase family protein [Alistipes timonensis]MCM1405311.1 GDSL-type esterase/lipase family protein [[Clostridium] fimetarium]
MKRIITAFWLLAASLAAAAQSAPQTFDRDGWEDVKMYNPAEVCKKHGLWKNVEAARDSRMKQFADKFETVMTSGHPKSTLSFAFDGDMFGLYDLGGPEMAELEVYIDGKMARFNKVENGGKPYYEVADLEGPHYLDRLADGRVLQHALVMVEPGQHQVTLRIAETRGEKAYLMLGRLLVRGEIAEARPVKGLPKMKQQLKWEKKISDYMARDAEQAALKDATLVVGSSSIDMWKSLESDFPGKNVIRRGVSGTKAIDLYNYRHLLIEPFNPKRIIIYEGDNEIGFKWEVDEMMEAMKKLFFEVRRMKPGAEICLVSVKPSPVRVKSLAKIQEFNSRLKEFAQSQPDTKFIDIHTPMLDAEGNVRPELFLKDGLHPAPEGYDIWRREFGKVIND